MVNDLRIGLVVQSAIGYNRYKQKRNRLEKIVQGGSYDKSSNI
jgi:hypothetical protein